VVAAAACPFALAWGPLPGSVGPMQRGSVGPGSTALRLRRPTSAGRKGSAVTGTVQLLCSGTGHHFFAAVSGEARDAPIASELSGPAATSASYYVTIDQVKYDRGVIEAGRAAVQGVGDGRISKKDASMILESILDGPGTGTRRITRIEFRSAFYLLREFAFTDEARRLFIEEMSPGVQIGLPPDPTNSDTSPYYEILDGIQCFLPVSNGIQYDRAALQAARDAVARAGDGRISKKDAEAILAKIVDGGTITLTEYRTAMLLLRESFNFTNEARKLFIDTLATR
jgi:hypothetical protein